MTLIERGGLLLLLLALTAVRCRCGYLSPADAAAYPGVQLAEVAGGGGAVSPAGGMALGSYKYDFNITVDNTVHTLPIGLGSDSVVEDAASTFCGKFNLDPPDCASLRDQVEATVLAARDNVAAHLQPTAKAMMFDAGADPGLMRQAVALFAEAILHARSPPWTTTVPSATTGHAEEDHPGRARAFYGQRDLAFRHNLAVLENIWATMDDIGGLKSKAITLPTQMKTTPRADMERRGSPFITHASKLNHDAEQISNLINNGKLPTKFWRVVHDYIEVATSRPDTEEVSDHQYFVMSMEQFTKVGRFFNTLLYLPPTKPLPHAVNPDLDFAALEESYLSSDPNILFFDNFLTPEALQGLIDFCNEGTIYFDTREGYLGAYLDEGLGTPLLLQIADELRWRFPMIVGDLPLGNAWSYKYDSTGKGIRIHADQAVVNLNFWITPDDANLDPTSGGLVVYERPPPEDWTFADYNHFQNEGKIKDYVAGGKNVVVPYRQNRLVMFHSKLFHKTDSHRFKKGLFNRRINLTFLFGSG